MSLHIGTINTGRDTNVVESGSVNTHNSESMNSILSLLKELKENNPEARAELETVETAVKNKDKSLLDLAVSTLGKVSIPIISTISSRVILKLMGM